MRSEEILNWMEHSGSLEINSLEVLRRVTKEFPFFQTANILYLINLKNVKDSDFQQALRKITLYAGDRRKLFLLVEADRFEPLNVCQLERSKKPQAGDSSFAMIDLFLSDYQAGQPLAPVEEEPLESYSKSMVSTDYLSTFAVSDNDALQGNVSSKPLQHQDVIDSFLEKDKQSPVKIDLNQNTDDLLPHTEEDESQFFSETLAKIYLRQKKYDKALDIIRKLYLLYPEKNIYFADQIRFLEKLIINIQKRE